MTKNKYGAKKTVYGGVSYDSKAEAAYAQQLDLLVASGVVTHWERQIRYPLVVGTTKVCTYVLDFLVTYADGTQRWVDVKGMRSGPSWSTFQIKSRLMAVCHGVTVEVYPPEKGKAHPRADTKGGILPCART